MVFVFISRESVDEYSGIVAFQYISMYLYWMRPIVLLLLIALFSCEKKVECYDCELFYTDSLEIKVVVDREEVCGMSRDETHAYYGSKASNLGNAIPSNRSGRAICNLK